MLSRAPHMISGAFELSNFWASRLALDLNFSNHYDSDQFFGPVYRGLQGQLPEDPIACARLKRVLNLFSIDEGHSRYKGLECVPRSRMREKSLHFYYFYWFFFEYGYNHITTNQCSICWTSHECLHKTKGEFNKERHNLRPVLSTSQPTNWPTSHITTSLTFVFIALRPRAFSAVQ